MAKPLVFISHKQADSAIASAVSDFITARSLNQVEVFNSSRPDLSIPRYGRGVNEELKRALWRTDLLILVYTSADQDWSFCMWECGSARGPDGSEANLIVLQCGPDVPTPFASNLRLDLRNSEAVLGFTKQFLTDPNFFPSLGRAVATSLPEAAIKEAAQDLSGKVAAVLPAAARDEEWPVWPFVRVELPSPQVEQLEAAAAAELTGLSHDVIRRHAVLAEGDARTTQIFGLASPPQKQMFRDLLAKWQEAYPSDAAAWFDSCCEQIAVSARRGFTVIKWAPLREVGGDMEFTPVLSRVKRRPFAGSVQFDIFFYNLSDPQAIPVTSRMVPPHRFFKTKLDKTKPEEVNLEDLANRLDSLNYDRVVILGADDRPLYVIHNSLIHKFITVRMFARGSQPVNAHELTLADLLARDEMRVAGENFVVVQKKATLAEARDMMGARLNCKDVFVTEGGTREEPALGWLSDLDMRNPRDRRWSF